jgi:DNA-binding transcriptional ArsR family regulator
MTADKASKRRGRKARAGKARGTGRAAAKKKTSAAKASQEKLYTLTEIGRMASVSMPTLQKYKRLYQDRIPAFGEGRKQRYPREAVAVLRQLKKENLAKRGRPPKSQAGAAAKSRTGTRASASKDPSSLLTLSEISRRTKISYPTVSRYVKVFIDRIPHVGSGRKRRFPPEAVAAFRQLRSESRPGRPAKATTAKPAKAATTGARRSGAADRTLATRLRKLEKAQAGLAKEVAGLARLVRKPLKLTLER